MSTQARTQISVVIPTYGRDQVLVDTVRALLALRVPAQEIVLADQTPQHDPETEGQLAAWHEGSQINWLRLPQPSIPHAMNQGLLAATRPLVLFLDDDIVPDAKLVEAHVRAHAERSREIVAGRVLQPWHTTVKIRREQRGERFYFSSTRPQWVEGFMGGNFSVSRITALSAGGFDENFVGAAFRFENDFADRIRARGGRIWFNPEALIYHLKVDAGGIRHFGHLQKTARVEHTVGAYYYLLTSRMVRAKWSKVLSRLLSRIFTRTHFARPWWIPVTILGDLKGISLALQLKQKGPRLLDGEQILRNERETRHP